MFLIGFINLIELVLCYFRKSLVKVVSELEGRWSVEYDISLIASVYIRTTYVIRIA